MSDLDRLEADIRRCERTTKANLARRGIAPSQLDCYDDPERGHVDPLDDPETRAALRDLLHRLWVDPIDPYGEPVARAENRR